MCLNEIFEGEKLLNVPTIMKELEPRNFAQLCPVGFDWELHIVVLGSDGVQTML